MRFVLSGALLLALGAVVDGGALIDVARAVDPGWLALAALMHVVLGTVVRAVRWQALLVGQGLSVTLPESLRFFLMGAASGQVMPTGVGGDVVRVWLAERAGLARARAASTVVLDRALGLWAQAALGAGALLFVDLALPGAVTGALGAFALGAIAALAWAVSRERALDFLSRWRFGAFLNALVTSLAHYPRAALARAAAYSVAFAVLHALATWSVARAVGLQAPGPVGWMVLVPLASLSILLPSVAGWGVREWSYVGLLAAVAPGRPREMGVAMGLAFGGLNLALGLAGALAVAARRRERRA